MGDDIEAEPIENEGVVAPVAEEVSVALLEVLVEVSSLKVIFLLFFEILLLRVDYVIYINAYSGKGGGARRYWIFTYEKIRDIKGIKIPCVQVARSFKIQQTFCHRLKFNK